MVAIGKITFTIQENVNEVKIIRFMERYLLLICQILFSCTCSNAYLQKKTIADVTLPDQFQKCGRGHIQMGYAIFQVDITSNINLNKKKHLSNFLFFLVKAKYDMVGSETTTHDINSKIVVYCILVHIFFPHHYSSCVA